MKILGVEIFDKNIKAAIEEIISIIELDTPKNLLVSATSAHGIVYSKKNRDFFFVLNGFYKNLPDGMPLVWIGCLKGFKKVERCYGPDFFKETIIATAHYDINHYFCGGKPGVAEELKSICNNDFQNKNIVGTYSPPFREVHNDELKKLAEEINSLNTHILWVGLSTPKQELFAKKLAMFVNVHFICTVGAAFDFHTKQVKQAPALVQKIGLEWLFRLFIEPKRLWKRYFEIVPFFIGYNILELISGKFFKNQEIISHK